MEDGNNNNEHNGAIVFLTADEILKTGLKLVGYKKGQIGRAKKTANVDCFLWHFGSIPCVCAIIWKDLQITKVKEACVPVKHLHFEHFLMAMHHTGDMTILAAVSPKLQGYSWG
jgi:hypothetical protein